nr:MAG TPA: hypothetical protein [Caudoviricetes sp.]
MDYRRYKGYAAIFFFSLSNDILALRVYKATVSLS